MHRTSGGEMVHVPDFPKLREFQLQVNASTAEIRDLETELADVDRRREVGDAQQRSVTDLAAWESERQKLKNLFDELEARKKAAQYRLREASDQVSEWRSVFAGLLFRRKTLSRELVSAPDDGESFDFAIAAENSPRARRVIERDLLDVVSKLARFSGDEGVAREYRDLHSQILARRGTTVLKNNYVTLGDGRLITEQEFQELAEKIGDAASRGAHSSPYLAGCEVRIEEAQRLGLT